jgi:hypothetical protein
MHQAVQVLPCSACREPIYQCSKNIREDGVLLFFRDQIYSKHQAQFYLKMIGEPLQLRALRQIEKSNCERGDKEENPGSWHK